MMPLFANPVGLAGLAALPLLLAIYLLRRRYRRQPVSALFLWNHALPPRKSGTRLTPTRLPWIFFLELLILSLLALAAADPLIPRRDAQRELLVVLDAGIAMRAPGEDGVSAVETALQRLRREFRAEPWSRVRVIEGRSQPVMRVDAADAGQATAQLAGFRANAPVRDLAPALALANRLAGSADALLVVTDRPPSQPPGDPRLRWLALGTARPNLAIVDALRGPTADRGEVCLVEVANLSDVWQDAALFMEAGASAANQNTQRLERQFRLEPGGRFRLRLPVIDPERPIRLRLEPADDFALDNAVDLSPIADPRITVAMDLDPEALHTALLMRALRAAGRVQFAAADTGAMPGEPMLTFREPAGDAGYYPAWTVVWHRPAQSQAFSAPFLRSGEHPLTEELSLDGVWWGAQPEYALPGTPLLSLADGSPLLTVSDGPVIHIQWTPERSTLQRTPDWPILIDNLLTWRTGSLPAGQPRNLPLGAGVRWEMPDAKSASVRQPDGSSLILESIGGAMMFTPSEPGSYHVALPDGNAFRLSVNVLNSTTSDLRERGAGEWGERFSPTGRTVSRVSIAWILLLAAVCLCGVHAWVATGGGVLCSD